VLRGPPYTNDHTAVFIWFDTGADADTVATPLPFIVISPSTRIPRRRDHSTT
jgi:hypothetical protein